MLDIKYYQQKDFDGIRSFYYYVGTKRPFLQSSIHLACVVRKVVSQAGTDGDISVKGKEIADAEGI